MSPLHLYCKLYQIYRESKQQKREYLYHLLGYTFVVYTGQPSNEIPSGLDMQKVFDFEKPVNNKHLVQGYTELGYTAEQIAQVTESSVPNVYYHRNVPARTHFSITTKGEQICKLMENKQV